MPIVGKYITNEEIINRKTDSKPLMTTILVPKDLKILNRCLPKSNYEYFY